jgi:MinD-like ATPase involved in chromosome partitioning or flagellar assembly
MRPETGVHTLGAPRVIVASGMAGTGVSTVAAELGAAAPSVRVIDAGARWVDIAEACAPGFTRMLVVTTHDLVSVTAAYALVKMTRDRFPESEIEILVNRSEARDALRTYERVQVAASHFLNEAVGYAGAVPDDIGETRSDAGRTGIGPSAILALHDLATRVEEEELGHTATRGMPRIGERRTA